MGGSVFVGHEAQAIHAGVHFQVDVDGAVQLRVFKHLDLLEAMHRTINIVFGEERDVGRVENPFQQQDRLDPAQRAQAHRALRLDQRQPIGQRKPLHAALESVSVRVGLDHCPDIRPGCADACPLQIVLHGVEVNRGSQRTRHGWQAKNR